MIIAFNNFILKFNSYSVVGRIKNIPVQRSFFPDPVFFGFIGKRAVYLLYFIFTLKKYRGKACLENQLAAVFCNNRQLYSFAPGYS
jgi:hypothetical protein